MLSHNPHTLQRLAEQQRADRLREGENIGRRRARRLIWIAVLALGFNGLAWAGARLWPDAAMNGAWRTISLLGAFLIGALIGRAWALLVTLAWGVVHAIPVYLGWLPGYLSTWEDALWWGFAMTLLVMLTGLGVISRRAIRWMLSRFASQAA